MQINNAYTLLFMSDAIENQEEQILSEETVKETDKKCPNCGATVVFDPASGMMRCQYCGYSCELPKAENECEICEMDFESAMHTESFDWGKQKKEVQCKQCGAGGAMQAMRCRRYLRRS